ncbi:MAG: helix-turn-helix domain-containing protein [Roseivirga sp.]|nr:helix-turn-helix domain-containing protein [Roseivirga sp.]
MIDFYWLKSFTEILQLFISALFIIYIRVKYPRWSPRLMWLVCFLVFKGLGDLYGIINYTSWIEELLTRKVLDYYRMFMASLELAMLAGLVLFHRSMHNEQKATLKDLRFYLPALVMIPLNLILALQYGSGLLEVFLLVRLLFILVLFHFLLGAERVRQLRFLIITMLAWNLIWFSEVFLHEFINLISEPASWVLFVMAELFFATGITWFLVQVIAQPKILRSESLSERLPNTLVSYIEEKLQESMTAEKRYRDPDLSLPGLAEHIQVPPIDLTRYLNRVVHKNFNQFITEHRIEESRELLATRSSKEMNVEEIMHEAGFSSKSVFNTAFKATTGMTPSQYRKKHFKK